MQEKKLSTVDTHIPQVDIPLHTSDIVQVTSLSKKRLRALWRLATRGQVSTHQKHLECKSKYSVMQCAFMESVTICAINTLDLSFIVLFNYQQLFTFYQYNLSAIAGIYVFFPALDKSVLTIVIVTFVCTHFRYLSKCLLYISQFTYLCIFCC